MFHIVSNQYVLAFVFIPFSKCLKKDGVHDYVQLDYVTVNNYLLSNKFSCFLELHNYDNFKKNHTHIALYSNEP